MGAPNDILIRCTLQADGSHSREIFVAINDESMLPEMERTAEYLGQCLEIYGRTVATTECASAQEYAETLVKPAAPRVKLLNS